MFERKKARIVFAFFGLFLTWLLAGPIQGDLQKPPLPTVSASCEAKPVTFTGYCPVTINFKGLIAVSGACTVKYKFIRSDGAVAPLKTVTFFSAGTRTVTTTWTLGHSYSGWEAIEVSAPVKVTSNHANFTITCTPKPVITSTRHEHMGYPGGEFSLIGINFGTTKGSKNVQVDGTVVTNFMGLPWKDTYLCFALPVPYIPWEHVYQFCIVDGSTVISNVFSQRFLYHFEILVPKEGFRGTEVKLPVYNLPASPGGLVVKIGTYTMSVTSWKGGGWGEIKAKVPTNVPYGEHDVYLQKGSDVVSNMVKFKVFPLIKPPPVKRKI
jgi:ligand-binding SRPBCC domain-containing protein